jgi:hypothetical protein
MGCQVLTGGWLARRGKPYNREFPAVAHDAWLQVVAQRRRAPGSPGGDHTPNGERRCLQAKAARKSVASWKLRCRS